MQTSNALALKEVRLEVTSMSPAFRSDRLSVQHVIRDLYRKAHKGNVPYGFINQLKRDLRRIGFTV